MDTKLKSNLGTVKVQTKTNLIPLKKDLDYEDDDEIDDKQYDEMQDQENDSQDTKVEYRRKLVDIPSEMLPCPNRLIYEASYSPPTQDEVKYYKASSGESLSSNVCLIIYTLYKIFVRVVLC